MDEATASAAEILAAALRDQAGALLLGRRTAGKGVGQRALLLPDGSGLSLTRVVLQAPGGERWDGTGLDPAVHAVAVRQPATGRVVADLPLKKAMRRLEEQIQSLRSKR
ncbi:MAG: S41 family peptidase [Acidobacteriota bacterium]